MWGVFLVVLPGLEPGISGPESDVLPLHHRTILTISLIRLQNYEDFFILSNISEIFFVVLDFLNSHISVKCKFSCIFAT